MKVLLSAFSCEPARGSEPGAGWHCAVELARLGHEMWVVTWAASRPRIEAELAVRPIAKLHFIYVDLPRWASFLKLYGPFYYYAWQLQSYFDCSRLKGHGFELLHHVTFGRYWMPSFLSLLPLPCLWGPVGGGESVPRCLRAHYTLKGRISETLRELARFLGEHDPFVRLTAARSNIALATTEETAKRLRKIGARDVRVLPQLAMPEDVLSRLSRLPPPDHVPTRFFSIGRPAMWKGFHLGLRAFSQAILENAEYWIVSSAIRRKWLEKLVGELGIAHQVKFIGELPTLDDVYDVIGQCDVLVHPSMHEAFGNVVLEAMGAARPVICLDIGGPALQVTDESGFKVPVGSVDQVIGKMAEIMAILDESPDRRIRMGKVGQARAAGCLSWEARGAVLASLYKDIGKRASAV